jgi:Flp pilus assembly protein TadG
MNHCLQKNHIQYRRGVILVMAAVLMVVLIACLAVSIDIGYIVVANAELQNAADAAAMAGARAFPDGPAQVRTRATALAAANSAAGEAVSLVAAEDVEIGTWDQDTATFPPLATEDEDQGNAVRVTCRRTVGRGNPLNLFIGHLLGNGQKDVSASAVAKIGQEHRCAFIGLELVEFAGDAYTDSYDSTAGDYSAATARDNGHICTNSHLELKGSNNINGNAHYGPDPDGTYKWDPSKSTISGDLEALDEPITMPPIDPGDAATVNDNDNIPLSDNGENPFEGPNFKLSGTDNITFPPGTYYFESFKLQDAVTLEITGPTTIYCNHDFEMDGVTQINNVSRKPADLEILVMGSKCKITGAADFWGVVYAPTADVSRHGSSNYYGSLVGRTLKIVNDGGLHYDESLSTTLLEDGQTAKLVQ